MMMAMVLYLWWQIGTWDVEIYLTQGAAVGKGASRCTAGVAEEGGAAVGGAGHEDQRVQWMAWMLHVSVSIATVLMEEEIARPAGENRVVAL